MMFPRIGRTAEGWMKEMKKPPRKGGHNNAGHNTTDPTTADVIPPVRAPALRRKTAARVDRTRRPPRSSLELRVIYEDDAVIAVNKPAGLTAVPVEGTGLPSAFALVAEEMKRNARGLLWSTALIGSPPA